MSLAAGTRLGPYEVVAPLGAGGMGEVYRARDRRLDREVAIKVLASHLSDDPDVKQRFEREARAVSSLSHPHICALYDVGCDAGFDFLVMELLEGETLAERMAKGTMPPEQVLRFGVEIAEALGAAHRRGIVHRDLKPGNVMLTKSGVKLLDFGLAKVHEAAVPGATDLLRTQTKAAEPLTAKGTFLGTLQYMAPEQLEGKEADARTDIFALGAVLYEMATGRRAFGGDSQAALISSILRDEPAPISRTRPASPPALDHVVRKCLSKDPDERWQSAHDVAGELKWIAEAGSQAGAPAAAVSHRTSRERLAWAGFAIVGLVAALLASGVLRRSPRALPLVRASLVTPERLFVGELALSRDGERLAFVASSMGAQPTLWIRPLDSPTAQQLAGTEDASFPFWSPDGRFVAFFGGGKLKKVDVAGGAVLTICDAEDGHGGTWGLDGTIVFAPAPASCLHRVAAAGGQPSPATKLDESRHETSHRYPFFLPDGRHFLYMAANQSGSPDHPANAIRAAALDGSSDEAIVRTASSAIFAAGALIYERDQVLLLQRFDPDRLKPEGDPVPVGRSAWRPPFGGSLVTASDRLLICPSASEPSSRLLWLDRSGRTIGSVGETGHFQSPRISPDGRHVAVTVAAPGTSRAEIWIYDTATNAGRRFAFGNWDDYWPVWSPDGSRVAFSSRSRTKGGHSDIWIKSLDGTTEELFAESSDERDVHDWSRDGRRISFSAVATSQGNRIVQMWTATLPEGKDAARVGTERSSSFGGHFSPDGRWLAFGSDESGRAEVYVRSFPGPAAKIQVSSAGGAVPRWRGDGRELYYLDLENRVVAVPVTLSPAFRAGTPVPLFPAHPNPSGLPYDVAADGQRFLVDTVAADEGSPPLTVISGWTGLLERR